MRTSASSECGNLSHCESLLQLRQRFLESFPIVGERFALFPCKPASQIPRKQAGRQSPPHTQRCEDLRGTLLSSSCPSSVRRLSQD